MTGNLYLQVQHLLLQLIHQTFGIQLEYLSHFFSNRFSPYQLTCHCIFYNIAYYAHKFVRFHRFPDEFIGAQG